ncbi:MAG: HAD-IIB family hydrolase [Halioglobus sp.]
MSESGGALVFTDLDGSLLDHHSYRFDEARTMLAVLHSLGIPVIPTTSKTRSEIEVLRGELASEHPFIAENGAAIFIPEGYFAQAPAGTVLRDGYWVKEFSAAREHWLAILEDQAPGFAGEFECFYRAGPEGIADMTGLSGAAAQRANEREYSEPLQWRGSVSRKAEFVTALREKGANPLQGGRFLTLAGNCDKGRALVWLRQAFRDAQQNGEVSDLAVGDSGNDIAMLEAAQSALVVRSPVHDYPDLKRKKNLIYSTEFGPAGWAQGVGQWLESIGLTGTQT